MKFWKWLFFILAVYPVLGTTACQRNDHSKQSKVVPTDQGAGVRSKAVPAQGTPETSDPGLPGRWRKFRTHQFDPALTEKQRKRLIELESIGYLGGVKKARGKSGVTVFVKDQVLQGINFYVSGHAPEAILMDMKGRMLHQWRYEFRHAWPDFPVSESFDKAEHTQYWRRAYLYENGDILAIFEGLGLIKLDKDSNLIWANPCRAHHDLEVMDNGDIYVLTREARMVPRVDKEEPVLEDFISIIDADGKEKERISLLESFENSPFRSILPEQYGNNDLFHSNTLAVLDGSIEDRVPEFKAGNILTAMLYLNTIAVVDPLKKQIVWIYKGTTEGKHDPQILGNGSLMYFNNHAKPEASRIIELDPATKKIKWEYQGTEKKPFYSEFCGSAQRLANGNTLITESDNGRAFEVTAEKKIVWEFVNPRRAGKNKEFVAAIFDLIRFPADYLSTADIPGT